MRLEKPIIYFEEEEVWKDIEEFEGLYEVSTYGRVKALKKIRATGRKGTTIRVYEEKIMTPSNKGYGGYKIITLRRNNKPYYFSVHRLVARHFIPNPENKCCVNHINSDKLNNQIGNLEWCTSKENSIHAFNNGNQPGAFTAKENVASIKCINTKTKEVYTSLKEAWIETRYTGCYETFLRNIRLENNNTNCKIL